MAKEMLLAFFPNLSLNHSLSLLSILHLHIQDLFFAPNPTDLGSFVYLVPANPFSPSPGLAACTHRLVSLEIHPP